MDRLSAGKRCSISSNFIIGQGIRPSSGPFVKRQDYVYDYEPQSTLPQHEPNDRICINTITRATSDSNLDPYHQKQRLLPQAIPNLKLLLDTNSTDRRTASSALVSNFKATASLSSQTRRAPPPRVTIDHTVPPLPL